MRPLLTLFVVASLAFAGQVAADDTAEFYIETPGVSARADVVAIQQVANEQGWTSRILRRYSQGEGWRYVLLVEGFSDAVSAEQAADVLSASSAVEVDVYRRDGRNAVLVAGAAGHSSSDSADLARGSVSKDLPSSELILDKAVAAMGGKDAGLRKLDGMVNVHFRYERRIKQGDAEIVATHDLLRTPTQTRLDVQVTSGPGVSSTTILNAERAWLLVGGDTISRDPGKAREVLSEFGPEHLLSYPLRFVSLVESDPAHGSLVTTDVVNSNGHSGYLLENVGPDSAASLSVLIDGRSWQPIEVSSTSDAGLVRVRFSDWRTLDSGIVVPFELSMERDGENVEVIRVLELSSPATVSASRFDPSIPAERSP